MKKLLYILLFVPIALFGQDNAPCYSINEFIETTNTNNPPILIDLIIGWNMIGYSCVNEEAVDELLLPIINKIIIVKNNAGSVYLPEYDFNGIGMFLPNQGYQFKMSEAEIGFELCNYHINYHQIEGCTDCEATNFDKLANVDDGSCQYNICSDPQADNYQEVLPCIYYGCNDPLAANYDPNANTDDGSCAVAEACPYDIYIEYSSVAQSYNVSLCQTLIVYGCTDYIAENYNSQANTEDNSCEYILGCMDIAADNFSVTATQSDNSCIYIGCTDELADNYNSQYNLEDGSCIYYGCMNTTANNFDIQANVDDESCVIYGCVLNVFPNYNSEATIDDGSCDMNSNDVFGCTDSTFIAYDSFANIDNGTCDYYLPFLMNSASIRPDGADAILNSELIINDSNIILNHNTTISVHVNIEHSYMGDLDIYLTSPNGIQVSLFEQAGSGTWLGEATDQDTTETNPGIGYDYGWSMNPTYDGTMADGLANNTSVKCGTILNSDVYLPIGDLGDFSGLPLNGTWTITIVDNLLADNGWLFSWSIHVHNLSNSNICQYPQLGYDCDDNITEYIVGMEAEGGIVFYVDSTGQHGLVAALEDIGQFEWGCYGQGVNNTYGTSIGTGYQNTLDIVSGCSETPIAASEALAYESGGYCNWFLPSKDELVEMNNTIGNGGLEGNIGGFENSFYWSSSEYYNGSAWGVSFGDGVTIYVDKVNTYRVRVIRAF